MHHITRRTLGLQRQNLPYIASYLLVVLLFLLGAAFYRQPLLSALLLLLIILPILSIYLTRMALQRLDIRIVLPGESIQVPQDLSVRLILHNPTPIPLLHCRFTLHYCNLYHEAAMTTQGRPQAPADVSRPRHSGDGAFRQDALLVPAEALRDSSYTLPFQVSEAGMFLFEVLRVEVSDFLHLYTFSHPYTCSVSLPILPRELTLPALHLQKTAIEAEECISSPEGELTSDLLQLREYLPGDRLKDVHWKMTAKTDELMVKEYDRAKDLYYLLLPELEHRMLQETLSAFYALGLQLLRAQENYRVAIYQPGDHSFRFHRVSSEDELHTALYGIYYLPVEYSSTAYGELMQQYPESDGVIRILRGEVLTTEAPDPDAALDRTVRENRSEPHHTEAK